MLTTLEGQSVVMHAFLWMYRSKHVHSIVFTSAGLRGVHIFLHKFSDTNLGRYISLGRSLCHKNPTSSLKNPTLVIAYVAYLQVYNNVATFDPLLGHRK